MTNNKFDATFVERLSNCDLDSYGKEFYKKLYAVTVRLSKETLIKGLTPFNSVSYCFSIFKYNKVDSEHLRNNDFKGEHWLILD